MKQPSLIPNAFGATAWDGGMTREFLLCLAENRPFTPLEPAGDAAVVQ